MAKLITTISGLILLAILLLLSSTLAVLLKVMLTSAALLICLSAVFVVAVTFKMIMDAVTTAKDVKAVIDNENEES